MKWLFCVLVLALSGAASAVSIHIESDRAVYGFGDTITITTTVTSGVAEPVLINVFADITWNGALVVAAGPLSQPTVLTSYTGLFPWLAFPRFCLLFLCPVVDQLSQFAGGGGSSPDPALFTTTLQLTAGNTAGLLNFAVASTTSLTGVTLGPNFQVAQIVPEPGTAALLGPGLLGLGLARRRIRS